MFRLIPETVVFRSTHRGSKGDFVIAPRDRITALAERTVDSLFEQRSLSPQAHPPAAPARDFVRRTRNENRPDGFGEPEAAQKRFYFNTFKRYLVPWPASNKSLTALFLIIIFRQKNIYTNICTNNFYRYERGR
ncbi:hypothetical protein [uncultured Rhodoblastus sp.]|uniref:hypothetical protein n=1 Tax=uncultured Rhodoblastus sp. TaxID=543037 RepID=UPI0025E55959|nr:hypothetical protein [uncultured Rhodoblastus sp.]